MGAASLLAPLPASNADDFVRHAILLEDSSSSGGRRHVVATCRAPGVCLPQVSRFRSAIYLPIKIVANVLSGAFSTLSANTQATVFLPAFVLLGSFLCAPA